MILVVERVRHNLITGNNIDIKNRQLITFFFINGSAPVVKRNFCIILKIVIFQVGIIRMT